VDAYIYVFLIDADKKAMNPIHPTQARKLLDSSKAPVFGRYPFTLILNTEIENLITYPLTLKIDPCSKFTGISLVNNRDKVIWGMEFEHPSNKLKTLSFLAGTSPERGEVATPDIVKRVSSTVNVLKDGWHRR
jgi:hypothetical protein